MAADDRPELVQVFDYRYETIDWAVARLTVRLDRIAARHGFTVETWEEDGLGPSAGCWIKLPSGTVIQLVEREHLSWSTAAGKPSASPGTDGKV